MEAGEVLAAVQPLRVVFLLLCVCAKCMRLRFSGSTERDVGVDVRVVCMRSVYCKKSDQTLWG
jgi:hypothetical protein